MKNAVYLFVMLFLSMNCKAQNVTLKRSFDIMDFNPMVNWQDGTTQKEIYLDYTNALDSGFIIPTVKQVSAGHFEVEFKMKNADSTDKEYFYKIYYQNESYKYSEVLANKLVNPLSEENFYGSWENADAGFISTGLIPNDGAFHVIKNSFRITGNPRDEKYYYGLQRREKEITDKEINDLINYIKTDAKWYGAIAQKAADNKTTVDEQLKLDALYTLSEDNKRKIINNRWKRNPRTGTYSFLLVITTPENLKLIPEQVKNISLKVNDHYSNPYGYFLYGKGKTLNNTIVTLSNVSLQVKARPKLGGGIFVNKDVSKSGETTFSNCENNNCNNDSANYYSAAFEPYYQSTGNMKFKNVPLLADLQHNGFSAEDYKNNLKLYNDSNMVDAAITNSSCPCKSVYSDPINNIIELKNQPPAEGEWNKINAGVVARHGFTYGKYTAKIKFPELINNGNAWNGLTNAFWLVNETNEEWNHLRNCTVKGFIPKEVNGKDAKRVTTTSYSEIDFEIRKASMYWPLTSYNLPDKRPVENHNDSDLVVVACTNWDLACAQPPKFNAGTQHIKFGKDDFMLHRWTHWYQALTSKYPEKDDVLFAQDYYYFQIEWKPDTIIWRIGPEKDKLKTVCFMNASVTTVPNNQMMMVFSQEYHYSIWWPESPFLLEYTPFTKNEIVGKILDVEIE